MSLALLQSALSYSFKKPDLLDQALTHRSHSAHHNERLEFLGDSILNCVIASLLYERFGKIDEGDLSRLRANLVKQASLAEVAQRLELSRYLRLGEGELKSGGFRRPSILADTLEAIFGAVYLDSGFIAAHNVIANLYGPALGTVDPKTLGKDAKTLLQEYLQGRKIALPVYTVVATHGAAHSQEFEVECLIPKLDIQVVGNGGSRRAAEQSAASKALIAAQATNTAPARKVRARKQAQLSLPVATIQPVIDNAASSISKTLGRKTAVTVTTEAPEAISTKRTKISAKEGIDKPAEADLNQDAITPGTADLFAATESDILLQPISKTISSLVSTPKTTVSNKA